MERERPPVSVWAREQRKAAGYGNTEALAEAMRERLGWSPTAATLRAFESGRRPPSRELRAQLEQFYGTPAPAADEPAVPSWASVLLTRAEFGELMDAAEQRVISAIRAERNALIEAVAERFVDLAVEQLRAQRVAGPPPRTEDPPPAEVEPPQAPGR